MAHFLQDGIEKGYANEVGEAFRSKVPKSIVWGSYGVSICYVLADTSDKALKTLRSNTDSQRTKSVALSVMDTFLWQMSASVIVPGFTINRICAGVQFLQKKSNNALFRNKWLPTAIGLIAIPFIIHPIDDMVDKTMNMTYRKWIGQRPA